MHWLKSSLLLVSCVSCSSAPPIDPPRDGCAPPEHPATQSHDEGHGVGHKLLMWLPNRVFDVLDIVRARARIGPGWTLSGRATELADINMGAHKTVFLGLHGPREAPVIPWPAGLEVFEGVEVSFMDATDEADYRGPRYGPLEIGAGLQVLFVGFDVGVEPWEALDFLAGIVLLDPRHDDL